MMRCRESRDYLFAFLDGELDAPLSIELQRHLEACPACAREAEIERAIRRQLGALVGPAGGAGPQRALQEVMAEIRASERRGHRPFRQRLGAATRPAALAAAALVLALGAWLTLREGQGRRATAGFARAVVADFEHFLESDGPLEFTSSDPQETSAWLWERTRLPAQLPMMQHDRCKLIGARSCRVSGRPAAFALYEIDGQPASLLAVAGSDADLRAMKAFSARGRTHWVDRCRGHTVVACVADGVVRAAVGRLSEERLLSLLSTPTEG